MEPVMSQERTARLSASPPLFENRFLDFFSRVHPSIPAIVFVPVVVIGIALGIDRGYGALESIGLIALGLLIWTLTEYWLHRLVFHWEPDHPIGSRLHFVMHGVHHDHPNDPLRLVMPPALSIPLAALFFLLFGLIFGTPAVYPLFAGFIAGYLAYDYTHYYVHHRVPKTKVGKKLREQHMRHHFQDHRYGFGVSSPLWDGVFGTLSSRRKSD
jgi:sterol desaturase/sphingolipid hydroxylase (fatty acid hydroxylase superfamily)